MFTVQEVVSILDSRLDAEGSSYYDEKVDYEPSINSAQRWLLALVDRVRHSTKRGDEALRDLKVSRVYQTSTRSRIYINDNVWTIDAVQPLPVTSPAWTAALLNPDADDTSLDLSDLYGLVFIKSAHWADEQNIEEWTINSGNPFAPGNTIDKCIPDEWVSGDESNVQFAYLNPYTYQPNTQGAVHPVIEVRP